MLLTAIPGRGRTYDPQSLTQGESGEMLLMSFLGLSAETGVVGARAPMDRQRAPAFTHPMKSKSIWYRVLSTVGEENHESDIPSL